MDDSQLSSLNNAKEQGNRVENEGLRVLGMTGVGTVDSKIDRMKGVNVKQSGKSNLDNNFDRWPKAKCNFASLLPP